MKTGRIGWIALLLGAGLWVSVAAAEACTIDGVPSVTGNGALAHRNLSRPSPGHLAHWAEFTFPRSFLTAQPVQFSENIAALRRSLPVQAFGKPWRWSFSDGAVVTGYSVKHSFRQPGDYKLTVSAYYSGYGQYLPFDDAIVHVVAGKR